MRLLAGVNTHPAWADQADPAVRRHILATMATAGFQFVRIDYAWATCEPRKGEYDFTGLDVYVDEAADAGLQVLLMLYWPPQWSSGTTAKNGVPSDGADFGYLLAETVEHFGDRLLAIEMFNEPDIDTFWTGSPDQFARMLADAYPIAKQLAPAMTYLAAAPTYLGLTGWFDTMYSHDSYRPDLSYDAQALHPYQSPSDLPPTAPPSEWSITGIPQLLELRASHNDQSALWVTEFGWSTHPNAGDEPNWKRGVDEPQQAAYTAIAYWMLQQYGIAAAAVYCDRDMINTAEPHERNFGLMRTDNSPKPVLPVLTRLFANTPPEPPDPPADDLEQRLDILEDTVAAILVSQTEAAEHLATAALAIEHASEALAAT